MPVITLISSCLGDMGWHEKQMFSVIFILVTVLSAVWQHVSPCVLPYSQTAPNTCVALTEQFDLSPCVLIGGPGLVIHGPFDCWHVKCLVPIPKAESWFAGSFVFSCLTSDPRTITCYSCIFKQQQQQHVASGSPCCCMRDVWSLTSFWDGAKNYSIKYFKWFPQISSLSSVSHVCLLFCYELRSFLFFFKAQRCS